VRAAIIAVVLAIAAPARADDLAEAKRLEAQLEYEPALVIVERLIAAGGAERDRLAGLHLFAGRLAAGLDRTAVAEEHFARVLALVPATRLPDGTSPKLTAPFDAARGRSVPLRVSAVIDATSVTLAVEADPLQLVAGIAVIVDGRELRAQGRRVEAIGKITEIAALDTYGNRLWVERALPEPPREPPRVVAQVAVPLHRRWQLWTSVGAGALAVAGVAAWRFDVAQDDWNRLKGAGSADYSELVTVEDRGRRWGLVANIGFGVAAAAGIAAALVYVTRPDEPRALIVTPTGVGVAGRF
jgi:hypothetical protein